MTRIVHNLVIDSEIETVFEALTTPPGLANWWTTQVEFAKGKTDEIEFTFVENAFNPVMKVLKKEAPSHLQWQCIDGHDNWNNNTFTFDMKMSEVGCHVLFVQEYDKEFDDEVLGSYNFNWAYYLNSLKLFCEKGKGTPYEPSAG